MNLELMHNELQRSVTAYRAMINKITGDADAYKRWASLRDDYDFGQPVPKAKVELVGNALTVSLDEPLDPWFFDVNALTREILDSTAENITLHINSIGGSVAMAVPVYSALRTRAAAGAAITTVNSGMVASAAARVRKAEEDEDDDRDRTTRDREQEISNDKPALRVVK